MFGFSKKPKTGLTLVRQDSLGANRDLYTPNCIGTFIEYLKDKRINPEPQKKAVPPWFASTNEETVLKNLITLMQYKGFKGISMNSIQKILNEMISLKFNRAILINEFNKWLPDGINVTMKGPGGTQQEVTKRNNREYLTFASKLSEATTLSIPAGEVYERKASRAVLETDSEMVTSQAEKQWILHALSKSKSFTIKKIPAGVQHTITLVSPEKDEVNADISNNIDQLGKKKCGTCWLCGEPIFFYHMKKPKTEEIYILGQSCGEDEHVLPPGWGNILGTLGLTYEDTVKMLQENNLTKQGLRPSHAFCNKVKSDIVFLDPPSSSKGLTVSDTKLNAYIDIYKRKLHSGSFIRSLEPLFCTSKTVMNDDVYEKVNGMSRNKFAENCKTIITTYLDDLCNVWTKIRIPGSDVFASSPYSGSNNPYTLFALRFIWKSCYDLQKRSEILTKNWNKAGGGIRSQKFFQNGGVNIDIEITGDDLDEVYIESTELTSPERCELNGLSRIKEVDKDLDLDSMVVDSMELEKKEMLTEELVEPETRELWEQDRKKFFVEEIIEDINLAIEELFLLSFGNLELYQTVKKQIDLLIYKIVYIYIYIDEDRLTIGQRVALKHIGRRVKINDEISQTTGVRGFVNRMVNYANSFPEQNFVRQPNSKIDYDELLSISKITTFIGYEIIMILGLPREYKVKIKQTYSKMNDDIAKSTTLLARSRKRRLGEGIRALTRKIKPIKKRQHPKPKPKPKPKSKSKAKAKAKTRGKQKGGKKHTVKKR